MTQPAKIAALVEPAAFPMPSAEVFAACEAEAKRREHQEWMRRLWSLQLPKRVEELILADDAIDFKGQAVSRILAAHKDKTPCITVLHGRTGTGKSVASGVWLARGEKQGFWMAASVYALRADWSDDARRCVSVPLLVIDDAGLEPDRSKKKLENLLYERFADKRPTVVTTNLTPPKFKDRYDDRVWDRIGEDGASIVCAEVLRPGASK